MGDKKLVLEYMNAWTQAYDKIPCVPHLPRYESFIAEVLLVHKGYIWCLTSDGVRFKTKRPDAPVYVGEVWRFESGGYGYNINMDETYLSPIALGRTHYEPHRNVCNPILPGNEDWIENVCRPMYVVIEHVMRTAVIYSQTEADLLTSQPYTSLYGMSARLPRQNPLVGQCWEAKGYLNSYDLSMYRIQITSRKK